MARSSRSRAGAPRLLFLIAVLVALLAGSPGRAAAHAGLDASTPAANSVLEEGPPQIILDFDEAVEGDLASIELYDGDRAAIELGAPRAGDDDTIVVADVPELSEGLYAVVWRVTSADGHVIDGAFSFQVGTGSAGDGQALIDEVSGDVRAGAAVRVAYGIARFLALAGVIVLLGAVGWLLCSPPSRLGQRRFRGLVAAAWVSLTIGAVGAFSLFGAQAVAGSLGDALRPQVWGDVVGTHTGRVLLARVVLSAVLGALLVLRRHRAAGWWQAIAFGAAVGTLFTFPAAGHPNSLHPAALWIAIDLAHLAAVVIWVGGLFVVGFTGRAALEEPAGTRFARRFSAASAVCVPVVVATGTVQALQLAGGLDDITATNWGRLLLTKVTIVVVLLAIAGVSRWLLRHDGAGSIVRTVRAEAVIGLVIVGLAAGMVALPPEPPPASQPFAEQLSANGLIAVISLSPGRVGSNEVHIVMTPAGGSITPVVSATARISLPSQDVPFAPVALVRDGNNHYSGPVTFSQSGDWTFELVVQLTETETVLLKSTVPIP
jgi:copper transport protein